MTARILEGRSIARALEEEVKARAAALGEEGVVPGLAILLAKPTNPSLAYGRMIRRAGERCGIRVQVVTLEEPLDRRKAFEVVERLNADPEIHGILVKRPLPPPLGDEALLQALDPGKDVDGAHFGNLGKLMVQGAGAGHVPCTPAGVLEILRQSGIELRGSHAVVLGRSVTVGKPLAALLIQKDPWADATVTLCHSSTKDLEEHTRRADLLVAAVGVPRFVTASMVRPGAVVVDVGTNAVPDPADPRGYKLVGDVDFEEVKEVASAITPVPGGVGPVTTAMLLKNLVEGIRS